MQTNKQNNENFSNRWGIILASLGMAIGAGNLWRFPRLAGQYGGSFIILWIIFLFIWSIPILLTEFSIGKAFKKSIIGSFASMTGKAYTWMGFFITVCTLGITFYYSVVSAWALRYLGLSVKNLFSSNKLSDTIAANPKYLENYWNQISHADYLTISLHVIVVILGALLLARGLQQGLEKANRILIPTLFVLLVFICVFALGMDNGIKGLEYMFAIDIDKFKDPKVWIEALSQSAWSTGAGWGLIMTLSAYTKEKEDVTLNTFIGGLGNNTASLLAGMAILPSVFALADSDASALAFLQSGNQALTFTIIPKLFSQFTGGAILSVIFFGAFFIAAFTSLLPMLELFIKALHDLGFIRINATKRVTLFCILFGLPSAYSLDFFSNQDWVWGIGLIISGLFIIFAAIKHGTIKFKKKYIDQDSDFAVADNYFKFALFFNVALAFILIWWWMSQGYSKYPWFNENGFWNVIDVYSNASIVTQWAIILIIGIGMNGFIYKKFVQSK